MVAIFGQPLFGRGGEVGGEKALKGCLQEVRMSKNYTASHNT